MPFSTIVQVVVALALAAGGAGTHTDDKAAAAVAAARQALGGEQKLAGVTSLSLRASYRRELSGGGAMAGPNVMIMARGAGPGGPVQVSGDIEIDVQFPDKYIKVDSSTGAIAMTRVEGFDGDRPFSDFSSSTPGVRVMSMKPGDAPDGTNQMLRRTRAELARLLLGATAGAQPDFPVTFTYVGRAESPDGTAEVLDVKGPDGFEARLFLDAGAHLPLMLTYVAPEPRVITRTIRRGDPEPAKAEPPSGADPATPPTLIEYRMYFSDFRDTGGLRLPYHITRGTAAGTTEEWEVRSYKLNPQLKPDRFKVS